METIEELKVEIARLKTDRHLIRNSVLDEAYANLEKLWMRMPLQAEKNTVTKCAYVIRDMKRSNAEITGG